MTRTRPAGHPLRTKRSPIWRDHRLLTRAVDLGQIIETWTSREDDFMVAGAYEVLPRRVFCWLKTISKTPLRPRPNSVAALLGPFAKYCEPPPGGIFAEAAWRLPACVALPRFRFGGPAHQSSAPSLERQQALAVEDPAPLLPCRGRHALPRTPGRAALAPFRRRWCRALRPSRQCCSHDLAPSPASCPPRAGSCHLHAYRGNQYAVNDNQFEEDNGSNVRRRAVPLIELGKKVIGEANPAPVGALPARVRFQNRWVSHQRRRELDAPVVYGIRGFQPQTRPMNHFCVNQIAAHIRVKIKRKCLGPAHDHHEVGVRQTRNGGSYYHNITL
nr:unnamed protein product [Digitaria exilis]